jgi:phosphatidylglycerol:prolipoprotein diacylglycerol transferase
MLPILSIGRLSIQTSGLIAILAIWIGFGQIERYAKRRGLNPDTYSTMIMIALIAGVIGARVAYVVQNANFWQDLTAFVSISPTMFDPLSGVLVGLLAAFIYGSRKKLPFWISLDLFTPGLAVWMIALGLMHLANGDSFGSPAQLPWSIYLYGAMFIWPLKQQKDAIAGARFLLFSLLSAFARLFLEYFHGDSAVIGGMIRSAQITSLLIVIVSGSLLLWKTKQYEAGEQKFSEESE